MHVRCKHTISASSSIANLYRRIILYVRTSASRLIIGHALHVGNLFETLFTTKFGGTLPGQSFFLSLATFRIGFVETFSKTNRLGAGIIVVATPVQRLCSKGVLVGIDRGLVVENLTL